MASATSEEMSKKNTDCVYFLASPLTCKKGNDCEFRHSESARINPRDCRYWRSGSCRSIHCPFRHPPLEGISEAETAALTASRPRVPCYFFSQGYCAKGDKCVFMHNMIPMDQKMQKSSSSRANDCQMSAIKTNGSVTSGRDFEDVEATADLVSAMRSGENESETKVIDSASRIYEGSDSSASHSTDAQRKGLCMNCNGLSEVKPVDSNFLHLKKIQAEDDILCQERQTNENMHQINSGDDRIQNGTESEELWEESSFDVLVDDGNDPLAYAEEMDFISSCDVIGDPLRAHIQVGLLGVEDYADYDYEHAGAYDQYYHASEYELATYETYEQQMTYDQLNPYDYNDGMHQVTGLKYTRAKHNRDVPFDAEKIEIDSDDLRNHIVKRRRAEKSHKSEGKFQKRQQETNGMRHGQRHLDGTKKQYNGWGRNHSLQEAGSQSMQQLKERAESSRNSRQIHGRLGEPTSKKSFRETEGTHHEEVGTDCGSGKNPDPSNAKMKEGNGANNVNRNRGNSFPNHRKSEKNDSGSFQGPKTLAQIKAEKMKASQNKNNSEDSDQIDKSRFVAGQTMRLSPAKDNSNESALKEFGSDAKDFDFEGPKPLSVILKEKHKEKTANQGVEGQLQTKPSGDLPSSMSVASVFSKDLRNDGYLQKATSMYCRNGTRSNVINEKFDGASVNSTNDNKADASNFVMEDMEFHDDDDDDEFAMKLSRFSS